MNDRLFHRRNIFFDMKISMTVKEKNFVLMQFFVQTKIIAGLRIFTLCMGNFKVAQKYTKHEATYNTLLCKRIFHRGSIFESYIHKI